MSNLDPSLAPSFGHVPDFEESERIRRGLRDDDTHLPEPEDEEE